MLDWLSRKKDAFSQELFMYTGSTPFAIYTGPKALLNRSTATLKHPRRLEEVFLVLLAMISTQIVLNARRLHLGVWGRILPCQIFEEKNNNTSKNIPSMQIDKLLSSPPVAASRQILSWLIRER